MFEELKKLHAEKCPLNVVLTIVMDEKGTIATQVLGPPLRDSELIGMIEVGKAAHLRHMFQKHEMQIRSTQEAPPIPLKKKGKKS